MNMWLESIANIQRKRPPPQDVDLETKLIGPLYACNKCGEEKTEAGYYVRTNHSTGTSRRSTVCKACELAKERDERARTAKSKPMTIDEMIIAALSVRSMTVAGLSEAIGRHRRSVDKALDKLLQDGIAEARGYEIKKYHPRVTKYRLTQGASGARKEQAIA